MSYYPFGSLKPGRYLSDTTDNCVTLNQTVFVVKEKDTMVWEPGTSGSGGYNIRVLQTLSNPRQVVTLSATMDGLVFDFDDTATSGSIVVVERDLAVTANVAQEVSMGLAIAQGTFVLQAVEEVNGNERLLASVTQQAGDVTTDGGGMHTQSMLLRIVPSTGNIKLRLSTIPMQVGNRSTATGRWITKKTKYLEQQNIAVSLCDSTADRYRFGFNGQEKVNEIAGTGNHNTAEFWEYDTRLGRRWNVDPVVKPFESGYSAFSSNPIIFIDVNGDDIAFSFLSVKSDRDRATLEGMFNKGLSGYANATIDKETGNLTLELVKDVDVKNIPKEAVAFYNILNNAVTSKADIKIGVVKYSDDVTVGDYENSLIDIGDMEAIDNMRNETGLPNVATSRSKLSHEIAEQTEKFEKGYKGKEGYVESHTGAAIDAENSTIGNDVKRDKYGDGMNKRNYRPYQTFKVGEKKKSPKAYLYINEIPKEATQDGQGKTTVIQTTTAP